ncbi:hypothetical protein RJT34_07673 [Clitoria ternatea]|uniref:Uncharacterized protein n=1 Tax=Clitoria ternatea TaxID=43366 RepID=A0AAN9K637_CLITE
MSFTLSHVIVEGKNLVRFCVAVIETGSEDDGLLDLSDDDFFLVGSSSDESNIDDEWTNKSTRNVRIEELGKKVIRLLNQNGLFRVLHLKYKMDMQESSGCT